MARRRTVKERWNAASAAALKLSNARRLPSVKGLPAPSRDDDKAWLRFARRIWGRASAEEIAAWNEANALRKPAMDGQNRTATRKPPADWTGSNDPLIVFIALWGPLPDLLSKPLTRPRINKVIAWLHTPAAREMMAPKLRRPLWNGETLERAIRRAKKKPQLIKRIGELQATK